MLAAHPYEEPAYDVIELAALDEPDAWLGPARPAARTDDAARVRRAASPQVLAGTAHGVRVAGDPDQLVETVGLCGGAGDFLLDRARAAGVDVYLTSDLRHHPASELREHADCLRGPGAGRRRALGGRVHVAAGAPGPAGRGAAWGDTVEVRVSATNTDPWTFRV